MSQTKAQLISDLVQALNFTGTSSAPANGAFLSAANTLALATNSVRRLTIDSSGNVGIGISSSTPSAKFEVQTSTNERIHFLSNGSNEQPRIDLIRDSGTDYSIINAIGAYQIIKGSNLIYQYASDTHRNSIDGLEALRVDSSSRLLIGASTSANVGGRNARLQIQGTGGPESTLSLTRNTANNAGPFLDFGKTRASSNGGTTAVQNDDNLGTIAFSGADGTDTVTIAAQIEAEVDGSTSSNVIPGLLAFKTANTSGTLSERLTINAAGKVGIGTTGPDSPLHVHKASAGTVSADGNAVLALENNNHCVLNMMTPADKSAYIMMGDPDDINAGQIRYDNNTNQLLIEVNSQERIRLTSSGRVGIGESNPDTLLHLKDSSPRIILEDTGTNAQTRINGDSSVGNASIDVDVNSNTSTPSFITTIKGSEKLRLNSSGNLGIGTGSSINSRLHVFGTSGTYPTVQINHSAADTEGEFLRISRTDVNTIRYHSIKATHSGASSANRLGIFLHNGSGDPFTGQTEVMRIQGNGRIGMGTTAPSSALEVRTAESNGIISRCTATQTTDTNKAFRVRNNSNTNTVTISYKGRIDAVTVNETSDIALKENIQPLSNTLEKIKQITGYRYNFKDSETNSVGVIAQDVEKVFPELVHGEEGTKKLQYSGLVGALIEAVKELSDKVATLEAA